MQPKNYLIIGATGGIGHALVQQLIARAADEANKPGRHSHSSRIFATYHHHAPNVTADHVHWLPMDITDERSIAQAMAHIQQQSTHIDWVINCAGLLHTEHAQPEKAIRHMETGFFLQNMQVNALASLLIAKHARPLLTKAERHEARPALFVTISARVGSISDNQLGGWYSYRMSKAALNMGMKNLSIEWQRVLKNVCVLVMQPGTVDTRLSAPFQGNVSDEQLFTPEYSATCLLAVLETMRADQTGSFIDWAGEPIPW